MGMHGLNWLDITEMMERLPTKTLADLRAQVIERVSLSFVEQLEAAQWVLNGESNFRRAIFDSPKKTMTVMVSFELLNNAVEIRIQGREEIGMDDDGNYFGDRSCNFQSQKSQHSVNLWIADVISATTELEKVYAQFIEACSHLQRTRLEASMFAFGGSIEPWYERMFSICVANPSAISVYEHRLPAYFKEQFAVFLATPEGQLEVYNQITIAVVYSLCRDWTHDSWSDGKLDWYFKLVEQKIAKDLNFNHAWLRYNLKDACNWRDAHLTLAERVTPQYTIKASKKFKLTIDDVEPYIKDRLAHPDKFENVDQIFVDLVVVESRAQPKFNAALRDVLQKILTKEKKKKKALFLERLLTALDAQYLDLQTEWFND